MKKMSNEAVTGKFEGDAKESMKHIMKWTDRDMNGAINLNE